MSEETKPTTKHAVILSGGGANGAYEIGILKALVAGKCPTTGGVPFEPHMFCGTSVGAFNAAYLVSKWNEQGSSAVASLEQVWLNELAARRGKANGVFRIRGVPTAYLNPRSLLPNPIEPLLASLRDTGGLAWDGIQRLVSVGTSRGEPLVTRLPQLLNLSSFVSIEPLRRIVESIDYRSIRSASSKRLMIAATNWAEGKTEMFKNHQMTDTLGPQVVLASTAIPGIFPIQEIGARPYVDGGVLMNSPLRPAIQAGAHVIHVISLNPEVNRIPLASMTNTLTTVWRQQVIGWAKTLSQDIKRARLFNRLLEIAKETQEHLPDRSDVDPDEVAGQSKHPSPWRVGSVESPRNHEGAHLQNLKQAIHQEIQDRRPIKIYQYRPGDDLGGPLGLLNFKADRLEELIERGFSDAVGWVRDEFSYVDRCPLSYGQRIAKLSPEQKSISRLI